MNHKIDMVVLTWLLLRATCLLLCIVSMNLSCSKALEEEPRSLLTEKAFYKTASDAVLAVNAA